MCWFTDLSSLVGMQLPTPSTWRSILRERQVKPQASPLAGSSPPSRACGSRTTWSSFAGYHAGPSLPLARFARVLALLLYALFGVLDLCVDPGVAGWIWMIRYAIFCPVALSVLALTFTRCFKPIMLSAQ